MLYYFIKKASKNMLNNKNSYDYKNRNLSDVFKELQEMQHNPNAGQPYKTETAQSNTNNIYASNSKNKKSTYKTNDLKLSHIITGCSILIVGMAILFPKDTSFKTSYAKVDTPDNISEYEINRHSLNIQNIISENSDMDRVKEQVVEERDVEFETTYNDAPTLPKGEEIIKQEGILGKDKITAVKTYENGNFVEEIILSKEKITDPTPKIIDLGTSEFLAKHHVHIGDIMYFIDNANLKESADANSKDVAEIKKSIDVKLLELCPEVENIQKEKNKLQRKLDRQRRSNNPNNYNENGTIKRGVKLVWIKSNKYIQTQNELREIQRKQSSPR